MRFSATAVAAAALFLGPASAISSAKAAYYSDNTVSTASSATLSVKYSNATTFTTPTPLSTVEVPLSNAPSPVSAVGGSQVGKAQNPATSNSRNLVYTNANGQAPAASGGQSLAVPNGQSSPVGNGQAPNGQGSGAKNGGNGLTTIFVTVTAPPTCAATGSPSSGNSNSGRPGSGSGYSSGSGSGSGSGSTSGSSGSGSSSSGSDSAKSAAASAAYVAPAQLIPAVHWDHPVDELDNLKPADSHQLYYTDKGVADPKVEHLFASLSTTLQHTAVILDHSSFIKSVSCSTDGILVSFTTAEAFKYAAAAWAGVPEFVLVTYADGCGKTQDQRTFWLISGIAAQSDTNSILAKVKKELPIEQALDDVNLAWGTYYPPGTKTNGTEFGGMTGGSTTGSSSFNSTKPGGNGSSNSTTGAGVSSGNASVGCGAAPSSKIDGFPAAACGAKDFDKQLDDAIGYFDMTSQADYASDIKDFVPSVDFEGDELLDDAADGDLATRDLKHALRKRGLWGWIKKAVTTVAKVAVKVATAPLQIAAAAIKQIPVVGNFIAKATEFDPSVSGTTDIKLGPSNSATSPWGDAALIFQKASSSGKAQADVTLYCVDCGIKGHVTVAGVAKWNLLDGLKGLNVNMKANMEAGLNLGLVATAVFSDEKRKPIINQAIPNLGMSVKGIFSAGVFVGVDAVAKMNIKAEGQALIGATLAWPAFEAVLDLIGDGSKVTGYEPQFKKRFEASGTIAADARLSLPVSFNVGIEIIPLSWKKAISLIEEPSLFGNVTFAGSTPGQPPASETCNNGFEYFANAQNDIKFDLFGIKTIPLHHYDSPPLLKGCKLLEGTAPSTGSGTGTGTGSAGSTGSDQTGGVADGDKEGKDQSGSTGDSPGTTDGQVPAGADNNQSGGTKEGAGGEGSGNNGVGEEETPSKRSVAAFGRRVVASTSATSTSIAITVSAATSKATASGRAVISDDGETDFGSNPSDNSADLDPSDPSNDEDVTKAQAAASNATTNGGFTYTTVVEAHNAFALIPAADGNLYAGDAGTGGANGTGLFGVYDGIAAVDDSKRVLHYYPDVMAKYGVSRIRLSDEAHIPKAADFVVLQPVDTDGQTDTPNVLFAVTTKGDAFSLVLCDYKSGGPSKLFIAADEAGLQKLVDDESLRYTVTGGVVEQCDPVALVLGKN